MCEKGFEEHKKGELADAFGTEGVGKLACGGAATFPEKVCCCGDGLPVGARIMSRCATI